MKKEVISEKQAISLIILFMSGSSIIFGIGAEAKSDIWLALIMAIICGIFILLIYSRILTLFPKKNLYEINELVFGTIIGKGINLIFTAYFFHLTALILYDFAEFINIVGLSDSPKIILPISGVMLCGWGVKKGVEILGRWASLFVIIFIIMIYITILLELPLFDINNLKPFLYDGIKPVIKAAFASLTFPFAQIVVFMTILNSLNSQKYAKVYIIGFLIGSSTLFFVFVTRMLVLGECAYWNYYFPSYVAASRINIGDFIQRIEVIISITFLIGGFIQLSICILACSKGVAEIFNFKDYRFIIIPITLLSIIVEISMYDSIMEIREVDFKYFQYYIFPIQVILPIIILIAAKIKRKRVANIK